MKQGLREMLILGGVLLSPLVTAVVVRETAERAAVAEGANPDAADRIAIMLGALSGTGMVPFAIRRGNRCVTVSAQKKNFG